MSFVQIGSSIYDGTMQYMEEFDACQLLQMAADYKRDTGETLRWGDALRTDAEQETIFYQRYRAVTYKTGLFYKGKYWVKLAGVAVAAIPGKSNHRLGIAIDFYMTPKLRVWLKANAWKYGFTNTQGIASGEEWHWVRDRVPTILAAIRITPVTTTTPDLTKENTVNILRTNTYKGDIVERSDGAWAFFPGTTFGNQLVTRLGITTPEALEAAVNDELLNRTLISLGAPDLGKMLRNPEVWINPSRAVDEEDLV